MLCYLLTGETSMAGTQKTNDLHTVFGIIKHRIEEPVKLIPQLRLTVKEGKFKNRYTLYQNIISVFPQFELHSILDLFNENEKEKVQAFSEKIGVPIVGEVPRSNEIIHWEEQGKTVIEGDPFSEISRCFFDLATLLWKEEENA